VCVWVNVSSGTGLPELTETKGSETIVAVVVHVLSILVNKDVFIVTGKRTWSYSRQVVSLG